ncbi:hypothetical protein HAX54_047257, partial [Datura stramonium]|nr:hypothetical protein [Datura stramonium]
SATACTPAPVTGSSSLLTFRSRLPPCSVLVLVDARRLTSRLTLWRPAQPGTPCVTLVPQPSPPDAIPGWSRAAARPPQPRPQPSLLVTAEPPEWNQWRRISEYQRFASASLSFTHTLPFLPLLLFLLPPEDTSTPP